jgi:hypothetical protein
VVSNEMFEGIRPITSLSIDFFSFYFDLYYYYSRNEPDETFFFSNLAF